MERLLSRCAVTVNGVQIQIPLLREARKLLQRCCPSVATAHAGFNRRYVTGLGGHGGISSALRACCCGAHRRKIAHALLTGYACSGRVCHDPTDPRKARPSRSLDDAARILQHRGISSVCDQRQWLNERSSFWLRVLQRSSWMTDLEILCRAMRRGCTHSLTI